MPKLYTTDHAAMVLIDHQVGTNIWASTTPLALLQRNVIILAKFAAGAGMPVVLTSGQETNVNVQGPLMPELVETLPEAFAAREAPRRRECLGRSGLRRRRPRDRPQEPRHGGRDYGCLQGGAGDQRGRGGLRPHEFGGPKVLKLDEVAPPELRERDILVRVVASGVSSIE